ncbi:MAG: ATP synthase subunit I [Myxococcales bacterium]|nr:ATP synthase subunit I [Myxococcales bacterium]
MTEPRQDSLPAKRPTMIVERLALVLTATATLISLFITTADVTLGLLVGGMLGSANFYALRWLMSGILKNNPDGAPKRSGLVMLLMLKFGLMGTALFIVMRFVPLSGTALLIGVSLVVFSIFVEGLRLVLRAASEPEPSSRGAEEP